MTILVVDDSIANRRVVKKILSQEGFQVCEAGDGIEALRVLGGEAIDAIISDILMPNMDGYRLCTEVRRGEGFGDVPFIFYTSTYTSSSEETFALELGADKFICKPARAQTIVHAVRELVGAPRRVHAAVAPRVDLDLTSEYARRLVEKLEEKNEELHSRTQELRETNDKLQAVIRAAPVAILSFDQEGKIRTWNPAAERIFGWSEAETLGRRPLHLGAEDQEEFERLRQRVHSGETLTGLEVQRRRRDGAPVNLELNGGPLQDGDGKIVGKIAVLADITERKCAEARLKKSEALLAEAQAVAHFGSWDWDARTGIVIWSDELYRMMGLRPRERPVSYSYFLSCVHPDDRDRVDRVMQQAVREHQPFEYEYRAALLDGSTRIHHVKGIVIIDREERVERLHGTAQDITTQSMAKEALRQSEQRFVAFMDNQPAFAWMKDLEGRYVYVNQLTERMPEYRGGWRGKTDADIWPREIAAEYRANDQKVITDGVPIQTVEPFLVEGETRYALASKFPIFDEAGAVVMVGGASVDITERIQAEEALRKSEERFRQLAENIEEVFWIRRIEPPCVEFVSPAYERIWKREVEDLLLHPDAWMDAIHPGDRERVGKSAQQLPEKGESDETYRIVWPDGSIRWIRDRAFPVRDAQGTLIRIAGVAEDITERKRTEQQVENLADVLQILTNRLFAVQEEERQHLARELHDEIGQSLTAVKMEIEAAKQLDDPTARALRLDDGLAVIEHLLQSIRALSLDLRPALLDEVGLAAALRAHVQSQASRGELAVRLAVDESLPRYDPVIEIACFRVAQEALTNVLRHARAKTVEIELRRRGEELQLLVRDDGVGFDVAEANARVAGGGSFGLLSMRERVNLAGGRFVCKSAAGQGTVIEVYFPLTTPRLGESI